MYNPVSTYRIQFNKDYTFKNFRDNLDYFLLLKPGSIYASPVFEATPGSMHGYDITNPLAINHEIGEYEDFIKISRELKNAKTGWIQDIVPNHMAFHMNNSWLMDVLEKGTSSKYSDFFDIDFSHPDYNGKVCIPVLGKQPEEVIEEGEIKVRWYKGGFVFRYFDYYFPFNFETFSQVIVSHLASAPPAFHKIWYDLSHEINNDFLEKEWPDLKERIEKLREKTTSFSTLLNSTAESITNDKSLLSDLLDQQHYKLCSWRESMSSINYRRFFTVNSLLCLKMENDHVFDNYHSFIEHQLKGNRFQGLRVDHIDGLYKPGLYLENLRVLAGEKTYIVAEKILEKNEEFLNDIPIQGTSGYDYLGIVNNLFTYSRNIPALDQFYRRITGIDDSVEDLIHDRKKLILTQHMNGELDNLARLFENSGFVPLSGKITRESIRSAIAEFLVCFPVYKIYSEYLPVSAKEEELLKSVFEIAAKKDPSNIDSIRTLEDLFINPGTKKEKATSFFLRCMQFTGPLMAKGVEDTVMYFYNSFIAHNEVGDHPGSSGISDEEYHEKMIHRQKYMPMSMNATSTHDTKRGEDVRSRLNVISELAEEWIKIVEKWMKINKGSKSEINGIEAPSVNEEYFIYQTLTGVFPFSGIADDSFLERMDEYIVKSLREAKTNSDWNDPVEAHEKAVISFIRNILSEGSEFMKSFIPFQKMIANYGIINSLSQVMLKATSPGIPDFYQGSELWDLSMVDPDNRRPVDYDLRLGLLAELIKANENNQEGFYDNLYQNCEDGRIKLWLTYLLLKERKMNPELFLHGKYIPLSINGKCSKNVLAYARCHKSDWFIVIIPRFVTLLTEPGNYNCNWEDTRITLPAGSPLKWITPYRNSEISCEDEIMLSGLTANVFPIYLKAKAEEPARAAGILAHISSLPGKYGSGDLGEEAYEFADLLARSGQSYWQILPFNPVDKGYGYSPYSSVSAFAGNTSFLSPDLLERSRLVHFEIIEKERFSETSRTNYSKGSEFRSLILDEAYKNFILHNRPYMKKLYSDFCEKESYWLDDYTLFVNLKSEFKGKPWNQWPSRIKGREKNIINSLTKKYKDRIEREKFGQFLFQLQWLNLKNYSNNLGIKIIGDMSFYVNYDSAEVWANPYYFKLDDERKPVTVAGVPPDYFSETGQLWNMPVYNWEVMKETGYDWWIKRIKRNLDLCDVVRFDHFRGFSEYWEVAYGEKTAQNGKWTEGPAYDFFEKVNSGFPGMPFIAEDLGDIDDKVYRLRDKFSLPGMVVLQFAFGDNTPQSAYIPHNHKVNSVVYTGTHDNNTTKGWFLKELSGKNRREAAEYAGHLIDKDNCHEDFIRMAYSSVAKIAIIPIQDILGLGAESRLNQPSKAGKNWEWKLRKKDLEKINSDKLIRMAYLFGRV